MARVEGIREQRVQFLYDTDFVCLGPVTSGADLALSEKNLFTNPTGDQLRTNMQSAGFLAGDQTFLTFAVRHEIGFWGGESTGSDGLDNAGAAADALSTTAGVSVWTIWLSTFAFTVGAKTFFEGPVSMTPAGGSPWGVVNDSHQPLITNGEPQSKAIYVLALPIPIAQREAIRVTEKKPTNINNGGAISMNLVAVINDYTGARVFRCYLDGFNTRDVQ